EAIITRMPGDEAGGPASDRTAAQLTRQRHLDGRFRAELGDEWGGSLLLGIPVGFRSHSRPHRPAAHDCGGVWVYVVPSGSPAERHDVLALQLLRSAWLLATAAYFARAERLSEEATGA